MLNNKKNIIYLIILVYKNKIHNQLTKTKIYNIFLIYFGNVFCKLYYIKY